MAARQPSRKRGREPATLPPPDTSDPPKTGVRKPPTEFDFKLECHQNGWADLFFSLPVSFALEIVRYYQSLTTKPEDTPLQ